MIKIFKTYEETGITEQIDTIERESWVAMTAPSATEILKISKEFNIEIDDLKAPLDEEERSRLEKEDNYTMILVDIPVIERRNEKDWYETIPLGIFITEKVIFTICLKETRILKQFMDGLVPDFCTYKKTRFVYQILYNNAALYLHYLRVIDKKSEEIEKILLEDSKNQDLIQLYELDKCLVYFTTSLKSNELVMEKMLKTNSIRHYAEDEDLLEDVIIENKQAMEMTHIYHNILRSMMSLFSSIIDNNLNQIMKLLAAVTIVVELPTLISAFYGMNVSPISMPFSTSPWAFGLIAVFSFVVCMVAVYILKKKDLW
ncbi:MAG: magnesium transporter CorA family protein [Anaerostipes sp.]|uniref:magnesium transporter CorA family protein n=1 Tax=Anaerostipes sp. 992a TaxID=1261637 RepID=UPI000950CA14|nr:magnesium transporter CorA family protein [Anaerostipes sp. 992a]MCI5952836.1 magnesium transporter CorA family protein [Anaerostipes sp.]MDD5968411.1 magnesium transporter CorA family protein [Anaerostipes sp.]OLR63610.1 magnesium transporter [Anaerostipes sp. 992a]